MLMENLEKTKKSKRKTPPLTISGYTDSEMEEETGTNSAEIIFTLDEWLEYNLPPELIGKALGGKFKGQKQKWFLMIFKGEDSDFNLNSHIAEFDEWRWRDIEEMPDLVVDFKKELYLKLVEKFSPIKDKIKNN